MSIIKEIETGISADNYIVVENRREAIKKAMELAQKDDVVVVAGKGHEDYQEINGERHDFSDLVEAEKALNTWEAAHA